MIKLLQKIGILDTENNIVDVQSAGDIEGSDILYDDSSHALEIIRHSTAHLMAQAIDMLYTNAKFFVGPTIEDGFYYDFKVDEKISDDDLKSIEKKMKELVKKKQDIEKLSFSKEEILERFKSDELKLEVIKNIDSDNFSVYKQGEFEDLCRGPHVPNTRILNFFKLTKVTGAYLGGNQENEMLTRVYGTAFGSKEALKEHLSFLEEAKKRDHRRLGTDMELFTFDDEVGAGLPIWLPNGANLRSKIEALLFKLHKIKGYKPVRAPEILKSHMWETSGHYQNYGENMYLTQIDGQEYGIKPMNCLGHIKVFAHKKRSYRELPLKLFEYGVVHRHEKSGVLHGLLRVREFTQDDAHIFCTTEQIEQSIIEVVDFVKLVMDYFKFDYTMEVSTKPEKYIGEDAIWDKATNALENALKSQGIEYKVDEGGGAFYGPKIDIKITDALKRKWQCGTIQVDFNLPERFNLSFTNKDDERETPVMIHRAILGSFERFIAILIEHFAGEFPFPIAPNQIIFVPISTDHQDYAYELNNKLSCIDIDSEVYDQNESLNKRIRIAEKSKVPMVVIIGDKEVADKSVAIRDRREKTQYEMSEDEFLKAVELKITQGALA